MSLDWRCLKLVIIRVLTIIISTWPAGKISCIIILLQNQIVQWEKLANRVNLYPIKPVSSISSCVCRVFSYTVLVCSCIIVALIWTIVYTSWQTHIHNMHAFPNASITLVMTHTDVAQRVQLFPWYEWPRYTCVIIGILKQKVRFVGVSRALIIFGERGTTQGHS